MQILVKDFNYEFKIGEYVLFYVDDHGYVKTYRKYQFTDSDILLQDIKDLVELGFRLNPYLVQE